MWHMLGIVPRRCAQGVLASTLIFIAITLVAEANAPDYIRRTGGDDHTRHVGLTADGRFLVFDSLATDLVGATDTNLVRDVFVLDRDSDGDGILDELGATTTERVSLPDPAKLDLEANGGSWGDQSGISADGRFVSFRSSATNLVVGDTNAVDDVFVRDRLLGRTNRISLSDPALGSAQGASHAHGGAMSSDGRFVAFASLGNDYVVNDTNAGDVFVRDRDLDADGIFDEMAAGTAATRRVSVATDGSEAAGQNYLIGMTETGRLIYFGSCAANLVAGDTNNVCDGFVRDRDTDDDGIFDETSTSTTERVTVPDSGTGQEEQNANFDSTGTGGISADGRYVVWETDASNLVMGDTNGETDVFFRDRTTGTTERVSVATGGAEAHGGRSGWVTTGRPMSSDGRYVVFSSRATDLVASGTNGRIHVYVRDRVNGATMRVNLDDGGSSSIGDTNVPAASAVIAGSGRFAAFTSYAGDLVSGDVVTCGANPGSCSDAFVVDVFVDRDGDGCADLEEHGANQTLGGRRNPLDPWDFFDVTGDQTIDLSDTLDILGYFGDAGTSPAGNLRDRDNFGAAQPWQTYESNTGVDLTDALVNLQSFGHDCSGPP